jgi:CrcB protein
VARHDGDRFADLPVDPDLGPAATRPRRGRADALAAIAAGGALGAPARYEVTRLVHVAKAGFPWATFWTNVSGSLVLGFFLIMVIEHFPPSRYLRPFFATGFLGAYTTFSTYMVDADNLVRGGHPVVAGAYMAASAVAGLAAVAVGIAGGRFCGRATGTPSPGAPEARGRPRGGLP